MKIDLSKIRVIVTDIDGTLTDRERRINLKAIETIRLLEKKGVKVILASSHAFPVVSTLAVYIGVSSPFIAESGAVIGYPWNPIYIAKRHYEPKKVVEIMKKLGFIEAKNNIFRLVDLAFYTQNMKVDTNKILEALERNGIKGVTIHDSGFAVHITPLEADKGKAVLRTLQVINERIENTLIIGDGKNDLPMFRIAKYSFAPSNAASELKKIATIVSEKEDGDAFCEIANQIITSRTKKANSPD